MFICLAIQAADGLDALMWSTLYFAHATIHIITCFAKIIIYSIVLGKKRKSCIIFGRKINDIIA